MDHEEQSEAKAVWRKLRQAWIDHHKTEERLKKVLRLLAEIEWANRRAAGVDAQTLVRHALDGYRDRISIDPDADEEDACMWPRLYAWIDNLEPTTLKASLDALDHELRNAHTDHPAGPEDVAPLIEGVAGVAVPTGQYYAEKLKSTNFATRTSTPKSTAALGAIEYLKGLVEPQREEKQDELSEAEQTLKELFGEYSVTCLEQISRHTTYQVVTCLVIVRQHGSNKKIEVARQDSWPAAIEQAREWLDGLSSETSGEYEVPPAGSPE